MALSEVMPQFSQRPRTGPINARALLLGVPGATPSGDTLEASAASNFPSSPSCASPSVSPRGPPSNRRLRARDAAADKQREACYWSDDSYSQFYAASAEEQRMMLSGSVGLSQGEAGRGAKNWLVRGEAQHGSIMGRSAAPGPRPREARGEPSRRQAAEFQACFAARSAGRGFVTAGECRGLLEDMGLTVSAAAIAQLISDATGPEDPGSAVELRSPEARARHLPYEMALQVYQLALLPELVSGAIDEALSGFVGEALSAHEADTVMLDRIDIQAKTPSLLAVPLADTASRKNASIFKRAGHFSLSPRGGPLLKL